MTDTDIDRAKQATRDRVWNLLESEAAAPPGVHGHIPDFAGADQAAARLAELQAWKAATVIKSNPDKAQLPVRVRALHEGKLLYMAVPKLATLKPFYLLDPARLTLPFESAVTSAGAASSSPTVGIDELRPVDLIVCGSVAVNRDQRKDPRNSHAYPIAQVEVMAESKECLSFGADLLRVPNGSG